MQHMAGFINDEGLRTSASGTKRTLCPRLIAIDQRVEC